MPGEKPTRLFLSHLTRFLFLPFVLWNFLALPGDISAQTALPGVNDSVVVKRVIDGDTIELEGGERIRYLGIDAPERHRKVNGQWIRVEEPFSDESYDLNRELVEGKGVRLEFDREIRDRYRRLLAYVFVGKEMINVELIRAGFVRVRFYPPNSRYQELFEREEQRAKTQKKGLWEKGLKNNKGGVGR